MTLHLFTVSSVKQCQWLLYLKLPLVAANVIFCACHYSENSKSIKIEKLSAYSTNDHILQSLEVFFPR